MQREKQVFKPQGVLPAGGILAIETSTVLLGVSVVAGGQVVYEDTLVKARAHSTELLPMCEKALEQCGLGFHSLLAVAVSNGPGSFTGLRIGCATAQGLALACGTPVILVPTLEILLRQCASHPLIAVVQGKAKAQTVTALYSSDGERFKEVIPLAPRGMQEFSRELGRLRPGTVHVTGDASSEFIELLRDDAGYSDSDVEVVAVAPELRLPRPAVAGLIAWRMYRAGRLVGPEEALPMYYRKSQAEAVMAKRSRQSESGGAALESLLDIDIQKMTVRDLDRVLEIEVRSYSTPWSRRAFSSEVTDNTYAHYFVARNKGKIVGYVGMWVILDEAHITNIAVDPDFRRQKVGQRLLEDMFRKAKDLGATRMTLEVRVSNTGARDLYKKLGFVDRGLRKGYYQDSNEDAIIMWKDDLGPATPKEDQVKWMV